MNLEAQTKASRPHRYMGPHILLGVWAIYLWGEGAAAIAHGSPFYPPLIKAVALGVAGFLVGAIQMMYRSHSLWSAFVAYLIMCGIPGLFLGLLYVVIATPTAAVMYWPLSFVQIVAMAVWSGAIGMLSAGACFVLLPVDNDSKPAPANP